MHHPVRGFAVAIAAIVALVVPSAAEAAYPQQNVLPVWPDNPNDASAAIGDIPYDEIAPKLNALQAASNRVSARVAGKSSGGYDLYAVIVTAPETDAEAAQQDAWRQLIEDDPVRARQDPDLLAGYKTPLFVNGNIHGNEKEGTDAIVRVIEQWATSTDPAVEQLLQRNRIIFNVTSNPDGRVANTRANAAGYDLNRDLTIASQPEARLIRDLIVAAPSRSSRSTCTATSTRRCCTRARRRTTSTTSTTSTSSTGCRTRSTSSRASIAPRLPGGHAGADPVPRRRAGRVGRLPADLRAVVRDAAEQHPVHDRGPAAARQRRRPRCAAPTSTPTSTRSRSRPR